MGTMNKYRMFVQDVGRHGYSGYGRRDIDAGSWIEAREIAFRTELRNWKGPEVLLLSHAKKHLWPDGKSGQVPRAALKYWLIGWENY
jgi:hypothetical protein